jgi:hypothetical protein
MTFSDTVGWCVSGSSTADCGPLVTRWVGSPFTSTGDFALTKIDLALGYVSGTNGATVELLDSMSGFPGSTVLESWTVSNLTSSLSAPLLTLNATTGPTLRSGMQYWVVAMGQANNTLDFWWATCKARQVQWKARITAYLGLLSLEAGR